MKKMRKMVSLVLTAAMTAGLMTGMGAVNRFSEDRRWKNQDYCFIKRYRVYRTV